jgi:hypothetical protein
MDAAVDRPPSPSPGRPAGQGGYGLFMIAAWATAYGWVAEPHCKHVWALFARDSSATSDRRSRSADGTP